MNPSRHLLLPVLVATIFVSRVRADKTDPVVTLGPTAGWNADSAGSGPGGGVELTCSAPLLPIVWAGTGLEFRNRLLSSYYFELGAGGYIDGKPGLFVVPSVGYGRGSAFLSLSFPYLGSFGDKSPIYLSPYFRGRLWGANRIAGEVGIGLKCILLAPTFNFYH